MNNLNNKFKGYEDPRTLEEAENRQAEARYAIATIERQLRERENDNSSACGQWRMKAKWVLSGKKDEMIRLAAWVRKQNRLVDLTLNGKEKLLALDPNDPNRLLLHTYNLARILAGRQSAIQQYILPEERAILEAVRAYFLLHPQLMQNDKAS
jgi:hypothetical protein